MWTLLADFGYDAELSGVGSEGIEIFKGESGSIGMAGLSNIPAL